MQMQITGSSTFQIPVSESTFTIFNNRHHIIDLDRNQDFRFDTSDLGLLLSNYASADLSQDLGLLLSVLGSSWHRQDLIGAPDFGWHYIVPASLNPVITHDPDGVTTYMSWGETQSFRTIRETGNLKEGLQITLEAQERRTYYIRMNNAPGL
ncbi:MAG: hypothetical protein ACYTF7_05205 [Planctomycetota bacterium]